MGGHPMDWTGQLGGHRDSMAEDYVPCRDHNHEKKTITKKYKNLLKGKFFNEILDTKN